MKNLSKPKPSIKLAILISGGGTTMEAIITATQAGGVLTGLVEPVIVVSSKDGADGIRKARNLGVAVEVLPRQQFAKGSTGVHEYGQVLLKILQKHQVNVVMLCGFSAQIAPAVIAAYEGRIFNQHPGPVPEFGGVGMYGRRVHAAVLLFHRLSEKKRKSGAPLPVFTQVVAQRVHPEYDMGAVVKSARVPILPDDTVESVQQRAILIEHQVQIGLLQDLAANTLQETTIAALATTPAARKLLQEAKDIAKALYPHG
jgi:phosphoribosylglycinamide formyltransferase-1